MEENEKDGAFEYDKNSRYRSSNISTIGSVVSNTYSINESISNTYNTANNKENKSQYTILVNTY